MAGNSDGNPGGTDSDSMDNSNVGASWADKVSGKNSSKKKPNLLNIHLERIDNTIPFNLEKEEMAKLLFKKMKLDPKDIVKIDKSGFGRIQIQMKESVNLETVIDLPTFDIRKGLRTKLYRPHYRKENLVKVSWLKLETPDELVHHVFSHFGKLKSNIQGCKIQPKEGESELEKLLNNIETEERQFWMEIEVPLPSYAIIDGRKIKIYYPGQKRTCARCQKTAESCPGNSNAKLCEENNGEKVKVEVAWKEILDKVKYTEMGNESNATEDEPSDDSEEATVEEINTDDLKYDGFVISNLEESTTREDIEIILKNSVKKEDIEKMTVHPTGSTRSKLIKDIAKESIVNIIKKVDKKSYKGRLLYCKPHVPVTPPKKTVIEVTNVIEETESVAEDDNVFKEVTNAKNKKKKEDTVLNIPGLPPSTKNKQKKNKPKNTKHISKEQVDEIPAKNLTKKDFLKDNVKNKTEVKVPTPNIDDDDDDDDEEDDDSEFDLDDEEHAEMFKSLFAKQLDIEERRKSFSVSSPIQLDTRRLSIGSTNHRQIDSSDIVRSDSIGSKRGAETAQLSPSNLSTETKKKKATNGAKSKLPSISRK